MSSALPYDPSQLPYPSDGPPGNYRNSYGGFCPLACRMHRRMSNATRGPITLGETPPLDLQRRVSVEPRQHSAATFRGEALGAGYLSRSMLKSMDISGVLAFCLGFLPSSPW